MTESTPRCQAHGPETGLMCVHCGLAICPRCMTRTAVGLRCRDCGAPVPPPGRRFRRRLTVPLAFAGLVLLAAAGTVLAGDAVDDDQRSALVTDTTR